MDASLDFFNSMSQEEILQEVNNFVPQTSWYNSLYDKVFGKSYVEMEELTVAQPGGIHEMPAGPELQGATFEDPEELGDADLEMLDDFGDRLQFNELDESQLRDLLGEEPGDVEMVEFGDLNEAERQGVADLRAEELERLEEKMAEPPETPGEAAGEAVEEAEEYEMGDFDALEQEGLDELEAEAQAERNAIAAEFDQVSAVQNIDEALDAPEYEAGLSQREG